jgi:membrane associated rhomboid family serine protease
MGRGETGGVAWFAHIGGFLAGMLLLFLIRPRQSRRL